MAGPETSYSQSIDLKLPVLPQTTDQEVFVELTLIYDALRILAQSIDQYTLSGSLISTVKTSANQLAGVSGELTKLSKLLKVAAGRVIRTQNELAALQYKYYGYVVPRLKITGDLEVVGKAGFNGKPPQAAYPFTITPTTVPASGAGVLAGAFDSAATRDAAIAVINNLSAAVLEIQTALKDNGIGV